MTVTDISDHFNRSDINLLHKLLPLSANISVWVCNRFQD
jgi:hypothetical protein